MSMHPEEGTCMPALLTLNVIVWHALAYEISGYVMSGILYVPAWSD